MRLNFKNLKISPTNQIQNFHNKKKMATKKIFWRSMLKLTTMRIKMKRLKSLFLLNN